MDKHYTVKSLDVNHHRIAVKYLNAANEPVKEQVLVDIDGNTTVTRNGHAVVWTSLRPDMEVEVKGGLELSGHIQAKSIEVLRLHV